MNQKKRSGIPLFSCSASESHDLPVEDCYHFFRLHLWSYPKKKKENGSVLIEGRSFFSFFAGPLPTPLQEKRPPQEWNRLLKQYLWRPNIGNLFGCCQRNEYIFCIEKREVMKNEPI